MKQCKNPTCDRRAGRETYCSRLCQVAMRSATKGRSLPDIWLPMGLYHLLAEQADLRAMSLADLVLGTLEAEVGWEDPS